MHDRLGGACKLYPEHLERRGAADHDLGVDRFRNGWIGREEPAVLGHELSQEEAKISATMTA